MGFIEKRENKSGRPEAKGGKGQGGGLTVSSCIVQETGEVSQKNQEQNEQNKSKFWVVWGTGATRKKNEWSVGKKSGAKRKSKKSGWEGCDPDGKTTERGLRIGGFRQSKALGQNHQQNKSTHGKSKKKSWCGGKGGGDKKDCRATKAKMGLGKGAHLLTINVAERRGWACSRWKKSGFGVERPGDPR